MLLPSPKQLWFYHGFLHKSTCSIIHAMNIKYTFHRLAVQASTLIGFVVLDNKKNNNQYPDFVLLGMRAQYSRIISLKDPR